MLNRKRNAIVESCCTMFSTTSRYAVSIIILLTSLLLTDQGEEKTKVKPTSWEKTVFLWREENESELSGRNLLNDENDCCLLLQNINGFIGFRANKNFEPVFIDGDVEGVTGYNKEYFLSRGERWLEIIVSEDLPLIFKDVKTALSNPVAPTEIEYRIRNRDGDLKWIRQVIQKTPSGSGKHGEVQGFIRDITESKLAAISLEKIENARIKEVNHRIKNNLQVISSLLSLEAEKSTDPETLEVFRKSQNRIATMSLIHQKLCIGETYIIDFSDYLRKLTEGLFISYRVGNERINLRLELEQVYMETDIAVSLGIIVNELVSNSLKHAFLPGKEGEIRINFTRMTNYEKEFKNFGNSGIVPSYSNEKDFQFILTVEDNGQGIPKLVNLQNKDSLGLQLVNIFVEQIGGSIELKRDKGTKFNIRFSKLNIEKLGFPGH
ncbi:histidine kinase [Methanosarcina sp. 2.H.T.1A.6]|uniref:sensor histidine kinase n=1 Tax=Methanosarcina sp. 2.H.T.1A.8 TaxID=1483598 RepID=UPI0006217F33|nr:histidine kinase dimerization/phosphoacceptor domain -containing protein [Methanosarcina sp. 2.H.T.1A.8]KKG17153.1 histidine kinase [Methanosarcina sp. 2.H.T.1A.3]KKG19242.1 histidine kinase [Methanosarcina sp. 2.H.T.1A.6]KKG23983.1 histidine kinase [Methanosarcina sp. 2.H.T.1A.8]KKG24340.1 histidine kinase [Methanosarcina sp. 2.H.T.1A.15]